MNLNIIRYWKTRRYLRNAVVHGDVRASRHAHLPLTIYKYSTAFQYRNEWDDFSVTLRGAVYDDSGKKINTPLRKFFNYNEKPVMDVEYAVEEKLDGSCVQVFTYKGEMLVTTLGSFHSDQANNAYEWLRGELIKNHLFFRPRPNTTYIFEWLDPSEHMTVVYKDDPKLVLITAFCEGNEIGRHGVAEWQGEYVKYSDVIPVSRDGFEKLRTTIKNDEEGFVLVAGIRRGGQCIRVKIKGEEYLQLHRAKWGLNKKRVWQSLYEWDTSTTAHLLSQLDEESLIWYNQVKEELEGQLQALKEEGMDYARRTRAYIEGTQKPPFEFIKEVVPPIHQFFVFNTISNRESREGKVDMQYTKMIKPKGNER